MRYMLMIHTDEAEEAEMSEADMGQLMEEYGRFTEELSQSGAMLGSDRLRPTSSATCVRVREGKTLTTDGPFADIKEQFGGYYAIEAANLDEAIAWAAKIPSSKYGCVEVRPIWEMSEDETNG